MIQKYLIKVGIFLLNCSYSVFKLLPTNSNKVLFLSRQSNKPSIDFRMIVSQLEEDRDVKIVIMTKRIEKNMKDVLFKNVPLFYVKCIIWQLQKFVLWMATILLLVF